MGNMWQRKRPRAAEKSRGWHFSSIAPGSNAEARARAAALEEDCRITYPLDLDLGDIYRGHHLIIRSVSLTDQYVLPDFGYAPEVPDDAGYGLWPNMTYDADVSPPGWNTAWIDGEMYDRPVPEARYAWFDFYPRDYIWYEPDSNNEENRIARLVIDLKTWQAQVL